MSVIDRVFLPVTTLLLALAANSMAEQAIPVVEIVALAPDNGVVASHDALYVHIRYRSSEPLRFQVHASGPGVKEAGAMMNPSPAYPAGEGEAIAWIAFREYFKPDSLTLRVSSHSWKTISEVALDGGVFWSPGAEHQPRPEWATRLSSEQQQTVTQDMQKAYSNKGGDWLIMLMGWSVPGYFILQTWIWRRWHDNWRRAGLLPLWASIPITGYTLFAMLMGSNLWPLVMLFAMPLLFLYLACLSLVRRSQQ